MAETRPACIIVIVKIIFVDPGISRRSPGTEVMSGGEVQLGAQRGSDRLFINPLAPSTESNTFDKASMEDLKMYWRPAKRSEPEIPRSHEDLCKTPFQLAGVSLKRAATLCPCPRAQRADYRGNRHGKNS